MIDLPRNELVLALDTGSPCVSVAVAARDTVLAARSVELQHSSERLIGLLDDVLREASASPDELGGVVALRGPGSFTGLRVGLATAFGLRQVLGCEAAAPSTLLVLAAWATRARDVAQCRAAVQARRGTWFRQTFERASHRSAPRPVDEIAAYTTAELAAEAAADRVPLVGFGVAALGGATPAFDPEPLAGTAAVLAATGAIPWRPADLLDPLYLSAPATSTPRAASGPSAR